ELHDRIHAAVQAVHAARAAAPLAPPQVGLILGSGLGGLAGRPAGATPIDYRDIPHFPPSHPAGPRRRRAVADRRRARCGGMQGRVHVYEGHSAAAVAFPARVMIALGARVVIVTNAAGGVNPAWAPGTLMLIRDHIDLLRDHALRGPNDERLGPRFPDMTAAYAPELRALVHRAAAAASDQLVEGVYAAMPGPTYETPAEIKMLQVLGADAVGMST